jgi:hypothetical protein
MSCVQCICPNCLYNGRRLSFQKSHPPWAIPTSLFFRVSHFSLFDEANWGSDPKVCDFV